MKNIEVADLLNEIANYLEFENETYKVRAYRRAALQIETLSEDIEEAWKNNKLLEIPGIGEGIAKKIDDFLKNGKSSHLEELKKKTPVNMEELSKIAGLGPKTILKLYEQLKIKNVEELKKAVAEHRIQEFKGFGVITEENILKNIQ